MKMSQQSSSYLPEVDGLRALAILAVLLYHLDPGLCSGGFLGVDLFFVISGFVITRKIAPQIRAGRFSFRDFYWNRARRLLPVFLLALLTIWIAAWWLLFPADLKSLASTTLAALLGLANYQFSRHLDYFAPSLETHPLLHLWSLAVEEQFYLFYPLLLVLVLRRQSIRWLLPVGCGLLFLLSCGMSRWLPLQAFYGLESRAWELGIGCLVALRCQMKPSALLSWLGVLPCLGSLVGMSDRAGLPAPAALPICLGTALLIATRCGGPGSVLHRVFVLSPVRYLGRISYSLYLIHWPVLALGPKLTLNWGTQEKTLAALLCLLLAALVHHTLENPVRRMRSGWKFAIPTIGVAVLLASFAVLGRSRQGWLGSPGEQALRQVYPECTQSKPETNRWLRLGLAGRPPDVLLVGDSHAQCLIPALDDALKQRGLSGAAWVAHATLPLENIETSAHSKTFAREAMPELLRSPASRVVLMASWTSYLTSDSADKQARLRILTPHRSVEEGTQMVTAAIKHTATELMEAGKQVVLVDPVPTYRVHVPEYLVKTSRWGMAAATELMTLTDHQKRHQAALAALDEVARTIPTIRRVPSASLMTRDGHLIYQQSGRSLYEDSSHLTREGAEMIVPAFIDSLSR
ncbi:acyltransferase family protein [Brevifollis gellanilyticus]|uniref:Acyltransferase n=1 Tax=Brevifollis gellanilyticus TaxID=748831 RepID=A0A512M341_9BACT|nr:acyltransferase family protein [Brevifollis gellanilyticus]GEP41150.1 acyltransferase [Brevifollis gellanilyticus]